jgi:hypothetical protein
MHPQMGDAAVTGRTRPGRASRHLAVIPWTPQSAGNRDQFRLARTVPIAKKHKEAGLNGC